MKSLKGQILLASSQISEPTFLRTVIFIVQHGDEGALGLVLNRPLDMTVKQACGEALDLPCTLERVLFHGGPCEGPLMALHSEATVSEAVVAPGIFFATERAELESLLTLESVQSKFFVGYSGWGIGQLENELESGSWLVMSANAAMIFDDMSKWSNLVLQSMLGRALPPELIPDDPSLN